MRCCTFFGNRDCPDEVRPLLKKCILDLQRKEEISFFYLGSQGNFDRMALGVLKELRNEGVTVEYAVVLPYHPSVCKSCDMGESMYPEEMEGIHPKYAISRRNEWMLKQSEYVICYVKHTWGGAYTFMKKAVRLGKKVYMIQ